MEARFLRQDIVTGLKRYWESGWDNLLLMLDKVSQATTK
jgi:hypothetical protein